MPDIDDRPPSMALTDRVAQVGRWVGPLGAITVWWLTSDTDALSQGGRLTAAIAVWVALWWMTEAIPLPVTALLPAIALPLSGATDARSALSPYASEIIFLFMGGFIIGLSIQRWNLHTRIGLRIVRAVGTAPTRLVAGFMLASALLSMWISNTASAMMMLPVGLSVSQLVGSRLPSDAPESLTGLRHLRLNLMLGIAYGASIGGLGTLIGSPPNLVLANFARDQWGLDISMTDWMAVGIPAMLVLLPVAWLWLVRFAYPMHLNLDAQLKAAIDEDLSHPHPMGRGERIALAVFIGTALAWVARPWLSQWLGLPGLTDSVIAMTGALLLFVVPVDTSRRLFAMDWDSAKALPWGILLLFGGGLSLAHAIQLNGVDAWLASTFHQLRGVNDLWVLLGATLFIIVLTELTSNTAVTNTFIPVLAAVAAGLGLAPLPLLFSATLAASCAFMLPVATPPNAIVYGSGHVQIGEMVRAGAMLNLLATLVIVALVSALGGMLPG
ncbi:DASS family sodium-coupled anion symporter [Hydrogenophaga sp. 5NK40-0174]|uniref:SLC13 family permease n=1 Tax=Hydrogenophaga sp. 5NK40-0174 TaxID=3127649 RepID=UPI00310963F0